MIVITFQFVYSVHYFCVALFCSAQVSPQHRLQDPPQGQQHFPLGVNGRGGAEGNSSSSNLQTSSSSSANLLSQPSSSSTAVVPQGSPVPVVLQPPAYFEGLVDSSSKETVCVAGQHSSLGGKSTATVSCSLEARLISMANYKTTLNSFCQKNHIPPPRYECVYPEDEVGYIVIIKVNGKAYTSTPQGTKRGAESMAAALALRSLGVDVEVDGIEDVKNGTSHGMLGSLDAPPQILGRQAISVTILLHSFLILPLLL